MSFFSKLFKHKEQANETGWRVGGVEDFMMLIRVYYQAVMAANLGSSLKKLTKASSATAATSTRCAITSSSSKASHKS